MVQPMKCQILKIKERDAFQLKKRETKEIMDACQQIQTQVNSVERVSFTIKLQHKVFVLLEQTHNFVKDYNN